MADLTRDSDRLIDEGRSLRDDNRGGGRHRRSDSIGEGSARLKRERLVKLVRNLSAATIAIFIGAIVVGLIVDGIGFTGIVATALLLFAAWVGIALVSRTTPPRRADINRGDVRTMIGRTELWLEAQRPALPAPAARLVADMGVQLDTLGVQLERVDQSHPQTREIRALVGEQLPEMIDSYRAIPHHLRQEAQADGRSPDRQLTDSLTRISGEIDSITRQLAEGSLDDLAIRSRFLEYKYGAGPEGADAPLPAPSHMPAPTPSPTAASTPGHKEPE